MYSSENLFVNLHRWASRQDENFTTEAFVTLLKHLQNSEASSFINILSSLSGNLINSNDKVQEIKISSQTHIGNTIPDIQIQTPNKLIFIEVKLSSPLERKQVSTYLDLLKNGQYQTENTRLVCLTRSPISSDITEGTIPIRWYQVAKWLEEELDLVINENSRFLLSHFIEFLTFQKATLTKVSAPISKGLSEYRNAVGEKKASSPISEGLSEYRNATGEQSVLYKRFRNLDKLLEADELRPLHDLMLLLFEALKAIVDERVIKFDSSGDKSGNGEVIYNINKGEYFLEVEYNHPETLIFKTYNRVTEKVIGNLELGRIEFYKDKNYKHYRWRNDVELPGDFIKLNKQDQLDFLIQIIKSNFKFAESITHPLLEKS